MITPPRIAPTATLPDPVDPAAEPAPRLPARVRDSLIGIRSNSLFFNFLTALAGSVLLNLVIGNSNGWFGAADLSEAIKSFSYGTAIALSLWLTCAYLNAWLSRVVDWLGRPWRAFGITLVSNVVSVLAMRYLVQVVWLWLVFDRSLAFAIQKFDLGDYLGSLFIALFITALYQGAFFLRIWKAALIEGEQLKSAHLQAKYETLNAQVNPHFLFNSLNVLSALVRRDPALAEEFIQGLSEVYRYVLEVRGETLVPLRQELRALDAYAKLVTMRFGAERIRVEVRVTPTDDMRVVPLALQMLIENAVKHNSATRKNPLVIEVLREADRLVVRNNRLPMFEPVDGAGIGLDNIRERYRLATGREVEVREEEGLFEVRLPL